MVTVHGSDGQATSNAAQPAQHSGLPVPGYQSQSPDAVAAVAATKLMEERVLRHLDALAAFPGVDPRWVAIGRTEIEKGFMAINRAVFRPGRVPLPDDGGA